VAKKSLGQNFLVDGRVAERIVRALAPRADETVIEIGPGRGALTGMLLERAGRVVAVEFDRDLVPVLEERFGARADFTLLHDDALRVDFCASVAPATSARVVANLPYNISTAILQRLIEQRSCLPESVLMLQREVVERMTARPGAGERGYLSVLVEAYSEAEALFDVSPSAFRPAPKVWSTVARLRARAIEPGDVRAGPLFLRVVGAGFAQRRKTMQNNLKGAPAPLDALVAARGGPQAALDAAGIEPSRRAESLTLADWVRLASVIGEDG
jgi:16S rRNA (adenine1518-N6/adenine1519-N6)-dimethyltransferase